jgi:hypothetical protein
MNPGRQKQGSRGPGDTKEYAIRHMNVISLEHIFIDTLQHARCLNSTKAGHGQDWGSKLMSSVIEKSCHKKQP